MDAKDREIAELKSQLQAARAEIAELKAQLKKELQHFFQTAEAENQRQRRRRNQA